MVIEVEVSPARSLNVPPPSVLRCHCTVGAGSPLAAAAKVTPVPGQTIGFIAGSVVMVGGVLIINAPLTALIVLVDASRTRILRFAPAEAATVQE
jgi:hypothetical protein